MNNLFETARQMIKEKRYKIISERMIDVGKNNVCLQVKKGRSILTCSCSGSGRFADNNLCSHKIIFIILFFNSGLYQEIDNSIKQVQKYKELNLQMNNLLCLDILNGIKGEE